MMSALARLNKLWISFLNQLLDGVLCKMSFISIFSFFLVFNHDFVIYTDFTQVAAWKLQLMTSQIRSHIEYLIQIYNILVLILYLKLTINVVTLLDFW